MPIIRIEGMPDCNVVYVGWLKELIGQIQTAVEKLPVFNIPANEVFVFFPVDRVEEGLGEEIIASIVGLFEKPERTPEVIRTLQEAICDELQNFVERHLPMCKSVECLPPMTMNPDGLVMREIIPPILLPFEFKGKTYEVRWKPGDNAPTFIKLPSGECIMARWYETSPPMNFRVEQIQQYPGLASAEPAREVMEKESTSQELADALYPDIIDSGEYKEISTMLFDDALGYAFTILASADINPETYLKEKGILQ